MEQAREIVCPCPQLRFITQHVAEPPGQLTSEADVWPPFLEAGWSSLGQGPGAFIVTRAPGWGPPEKQYPVAPSSWRYILDNNNNSNPEVCVCL